ncbi:hypothetical protein Tco_1455265 [Tanacetum coccineum]
MKVLTIGFSSSNQLIRSLIVPSADVAATWASRTQSADVVLPRRLTWDSYADVEMGPNATWYQSGGDTWKGANGSLTCGNEELVRGLGGSSRSVQGTVAASGSKPIIGSTIQGSRRGTWHNLIGGSRIWQLVSDQYEEWEIRVGLGYKMERAAARYS